MTAAPENGSLAALRILVVEDEMVLMMMLEDALADAGCAPLKASNVAKAAALAEAAALDFAILDVNVAGKEIYPVAAILGRRNIPFLLSTGYGRESLPAELRHRPILRKPFLPEHVEPAILAALTP